MMEKEEKKSRLLTHTSTVRCATLGHRARALSSSSRSFYMHFFFVSSRLNECNHTPLQPFKFSLLNLPSQRLFIININFRVAYYFFRNSSRCSAECKMASGKRKNCRFDIGRTRQLAATMQEVESPFSEFEQKGGKSSDDEGTAEAEKNSSIITFAKVIYLIAIQIR